MNAERLYQHKLRNALHSMLLLGAMSVLLGLLGWIIGGASTAFAALFFVIALYWLNPLVLPWFVLRLYRAQPISRGQAPRLYAALEILAERAGLPAAPSLFYVPSRVLNAFAVGTPGHAAIGVSDGLLRRLELPALAGVLAHEISHIQHEDIRVMSFADMVTRLTHILSGAGWLLLFLSLPFLVFGGYMVNIWALLLLLGAPTLSALLQLALSRNREYDADLGAVELLGDPRPLIDGLAQIHNAQGRFIEQIIRPGQGVPEPSLLRTHPPTEERIRRLRELQPPHRPGLWEDIAFPTYQSPPFANFGGAGRPRRYFGGIWF